MLNIHSPFFLFQNCHQRKTAIRGLLHGMVSRIISKEYQQYPLLGLGAQGKPCSWAPWRPWEAGWQLQGASFSFPPPGSTVRAPHSASQIRCEDLLTSMHRMFRCQIRARDSRHFVVFLTQDYLIFRRQLNLFLRSYMLTTTVTRMICPTYS